MATTDCSALKARARKSTSRSVPNWVLYNIWEHTWDTRQRMLLRTDDKANKGLAGSPQQNWRRCGLRTRHCGWRSKHRRNPGSHDYYMPDMDEVAEEEARELYNNHLRGGEGHMEVGKLSDECGTKSDNDAVGQMPFGCMPSSAFRMACSRM